MDINTTLKQIGTGNLMAVGAREFTRDGKNGLIMRVGSKRGVKEALVIRLEPSDTYSVRYVSINTRTFKQTEETVTDVYCDALGAVVRRLGDR